MTVSICKTDSYILFSFEADTLTQKITGYAGTVSSVDFSQLALTKRVHLTKKKSEIGSTVLLHFFTDARIVYEVPTCSVLC